MTGIRHSSLIVLVGLGFMGTASSARAAHLNILDHVDGEITLEHDANWEFGAVSNGAFFGGNVPGSTTVPGESADFFGEWIAPGQGDPDPGTGVIYIVDQNDPNLIRAIITAFWSNPDSFSASISIEVQSSPCGTVLGSLPAAFAGLGIAEPDGCMGIEGLFRDPATGVAAIIPSNLTLGYCAEPSDCDQQGCIEIDGVTYLRTGDCETVTAPFTTPDAAITTGSYSGYVELRVLGSGESLGTCVNDAFCIYTCGPVGHDGQFYQLTESSATLVGNGGPGFDTQQAYKKIVYDLDAGTEVTPPYTPAFRADHTYHFVLDTALVIPGSLHFGVSDGNFGDNSGAYIVQVCQLVAAVPVFDDCTDSETELECNPEIIPECDPYVTASHECGQAVVDCAETDAVDGCRHTLVLTYTATNGENTATCTQASTWTDDTTGPAIECADLTVECDGQGNVAELNEWLASVTPTDECGSATIVNDFTGLSDGPGATGSALVTWTATDECDNSSTCYATFTIEDTTSQSAVVTGPGPVMWPPNHKYQTFQLSDCNVTIEDDCDGTALDVNSSGAIVSIHSDEPENAKGNGDGNTFDDIVILGPSSFQLRAERNGTGNGRVYGISFEVTDASENSTLVVCHVSVPHDQSGAPAVDDGAAAGYTVP